MHIIRPIKHSDLSTYVACAFAAQVGMASMPKNDEILEEKLEKSIKDFSREIKSPSDEFYLFILEDLHTDTTGGVSGIYAKTGVKSPSYFYKIDKIQNKKDENLPIPEEMRVLRPISYENGPTEVCSLYLLPEFRKEGLGRLLSLSRFLYIARERKRFDDTIIADLRGVIDGEDSVFWQLFGRKFLDIPFCDVMKLIEKDTNFISKILPQFPVYVDLLPRHLKAIIAKTYVNTGGAEKMLTEEGFEYAEEINTLDGGPKMIAKTEKVRIVGHSKTAKIVEVEQLINQGKRSIAANEQGPFRAGIGMIQEDKNGVILDKLVADALNVQKGETIRYLEDK